MGSVVCHSLVLSIRVLCAVLIERCAVDRGGCLWLNMGCALETVTSNGDPNEFFSRDLSVHIVSGVCGISLSYAFGYNVVCCGLR